MDVNEYGKAWRVDPTAGAGHGFYFKHQPPAYRKVAEILAKGEKATVYQWQGPPDTGRWALYEVLPDVYPQ